MSVRCHGSSTQPWRSLCRRRGEQLDVGKLHSDTTAPSRIERSSQRRAAARLKQEQAEGTDVAPAETIARLTAAASLDVRIHRSKRRPSYETIRLHDSFPSFLNVKTDRVGRTKRSMSNRIRHKGSARLPPRGFLLTEPIRIINSPSTIGVLCLTHIGNNGKNRLLCPYYET